MQKNTSHSNLLIFSENELSSLFNTQEAKNRFLKEKNKLIRNVYNELFYNLEENDYKDENIGITYKNKNFYITPLNIIKELAFSIGLNEEYNKNLKDIYDYNALYQEFSKMINKRIALTIKISSFDDLKELDEDIYNVIEQDNLSDKKKQRVLKEIKSIMIKELKKTLKQAETIFLKNDLYISSNLLINFDQEKKELLINAKKLEKLEKTSVGEINFDNITDITNYYLKISKTSNNKNIVLEKEDKNISYSPSDFKTDYQNFLKKLLQYGSKNEELYRIINSCLLKKDDYHINQPTIDKKIYQKEAKDTSKRKKMSLEDKLKLLNDKEKFFNNSNYLYKIEGINKLKDYNGYIYPNGKIVFEKYYTTKTSSLPTIEEAIYVMDIKNFLYMTNYSRKEIIAYIDNYNCKNVRRIYHYENWQREVLKEINQKTKYNKDNIEKEILKALTKYKSKKENILNHINIFKNFKVCVKEQIPRLKSIQQ